jgi:hypothetical protein
MHTKLLPSICIESVFGDLSIEQAYRARAQADIKPQHMLH